MLVKVVGVFTQIGALLKNAVGLSKIWMVKLESFEQLLSLSRKIDMLLMPGWLK